MGWISSSPEPQLEGGNASTKAPWTIKRFISHNPSSPSTNDIPGIQIAKKISSILSDVTKSTVSEDDELSSNNEQPSVAALAKPNHRGRKGRVTTTASPRRSPSLQDVQQRLRATTKHPFAIVFSSDEGDSIIRQREEMMPTYSVSYRERTQDTSLLEEETILTMDTEEKKNQTFDMEWKEEHLNRATWKDSPSKIMRSVVSGMFSCATCKADTTIDEEEEYAIFNSRADAKNKCDITESTTTTSVDDSQLGKSASKQEQPILSLSAAAAAAAAAEKRKEESKKRKNRKPIIITTLVEHAIPPPKPPKREQSALSLDYRNHNDEVLPPSTITIRKKSHLCGGYANDDEPKVILVVPDFKGQGPNDINEIHFLTADGETEAIIDRERACRRGYEI